MNDIFGCAVSEFAGGYTSEAPIHRVDLNEYNFDISGRNPDNGNVPRSLRKCTDIGFAIPVTLGGRADKGG